MRLPRSPIPLLLALLAAPACDAADSGDDDDSAADAAPAADADPNAPDADPNAPDGATAVDCQFENLQYDLLAETVQLESAGGGTCVKLTRRNDCPPDWICKAVPFTVLTFRVGHDGAMAFIDDEDAMHWEATHHNWNDWGEATGAGVRYRLESRFADGSVDLYELSAYDAESDALLWGPIDLEAYVP